MKIRAEKLSNGKYELFLEIPPIKLPVWYSKEDIETLEKNGILFGRNSYNASTTLEFQLKKELKNEIENSIMDAITEKTL